MLTRSSGPYNRHNLSDGKILAHIRDGTDPKQIARLINNDIEYRRQKEAERKANEDFFTLVRDDANYLGILPKVKTFLTNTRDALEEEHWLFLTNVLHALEKAQWLNDVIALLASLLNADMLVAVLFLFKSLPYTAKSALDYSKNRSNETLLTINLLILIAYTAITTICFVMAAIHLHYSTLISSPFSVARNLWQISESILHLTGVGLNEAKSRERQNLLSTYNNTMLDKEVRQKACHDLYNAQAKKIGRNIHQLVLSVVTLTLYVILAVNPTTALIIHILTACIMLYFIYDALAPRQGPFENPLRKMGSHLVDWLIPKPIDKKPIDTKPNDTKQIPAAIDTPEKKENNAPSSTKKTAVTLSNAIVRFFDFKSQYTRPEQSNTPTADLDLASDNRLAPA